MRTGFAIALFFTHCFAGGCGVGVFPDGSSTQLDTSEVAVDGADAPVDVPSTVDLAIQIMARDYHPLLRPQANVFVRVVGGSGETLFDGQTDAMGRVPSVFRLANAPFSVTAGRRDLGLISVVAMTTALSHPIAFLLPLYGERDLIVRPPAQSVVNRARVLFDDPRAFFLVSTNDCQLENSFETPRLRLSRRLMTTARACWIRVEGG